MRRLRREVPEEGHPPLRDGIRSTKYPVRSRSKGRLLFTFVMFAKKYNLSLLFLYIVFLDAQWYDIDTSRKADKTSKIIVSVTQRIITLIKKEKKKIFKNYRQCY
jgi:hypothetical protein